MSPAAPSEPSAPALPGHPEILPLGCDALIVRFALVADPAANAAAQVLARALEAAPPGGVVEVVPSLASVMVRFDPERAPRAQVVAALEEVLAGRDWSTVALPPARRRWRIPAAFGGGHGPDLEAVADAIGLTPAQAVAEFCASRLRVLAIGFAPGQPYLGLLPQRWDLPRLPALTPRVPAGALVVAVRQVVLFANPSPTGWRQVGRCAFRPFRPEAEAPFPLRAGDEVMFEPVSGQEFDRLRAAGQDGARLEELA